MEPEYQFNSNCIQLRDKSGGIPDKAIDEMLNTGMCKNFSSYYIDDANPFMQVSLYEMMIGHPRLKELISAELHEYCQQFIEVLPEFREVAAEMIAEVSEKDIENFIKHRENSQLTHDDGNC